MKKQLTFLIILIAIAAVFASGCSTTVRDSVPATQISGQLNGKPFKFTGPKDLAVEAIDITAATNGEFAIHIKNLNAKTNPDIITTTGEAQAKMIGATGDAITKAIVGAGGAAGAAAAAGLKP